MNTRRIFFIVAIICSPTIKSNPQTEFDNLNPNVPQNSKEKLNSHSHTANEEPINIVINATELCTKENCHFLFGKKLIKCMESLERDELLNNFKQLNPRAARNYLLSLNLIEYKEFLENFTLNDWKDYYISLPNEYKNKFPRTKEEQLEAIERSNKIENSNNNLTIFGRFILYITGFKLAEKNQETVFELQKNQLFNR